MEDEILVDDVPHVVIDTEESGAGSRGLGDGGRNT